MILADPAYAIEAALDYLEVARPDLSARPTVAMGFQRGCSLCRPRRPGCTTD